MAAETHQLEDDSGREIFAIVDGPLDEDHGRWIATPDPVEVER